MTPRQAAPRTLARHEAALLWGGLLTTAGLLVALVVTTPVLAPLATGPLLLVLLATRVPGLRNRAERDAKTGLLNVEAFDRCMEAALAASRRPGSPCAVVMVDLDHLRAVNNRFGHLVGDRLIEATAGVLAAACPAGSSAARFGGDEFCLLLPGVDATGAREVAEKVRAGVEALDELPKCESPLGTVSVGVAATPDQGTTAETLLQAADAALYDAKLGGRNRVRVALPEASRETFALPLAPDDRVDSALRQIAAHVAGDVPPDDAAEPAAQSAEPTIETRRLIPYLAAALCLTVVPVALLSDPARIEEAPVLFSALVATTVLLDLLRIDLFERLQTSPACLPVIVLACVFGPLGPIAAEVAIVGVRLLQRTPALRWTFDFGLLSLAGAAAAVAFAAGTAPDPSSANLIVMGAVAGAAYYAANMPLLAVVIGLSRGTSPLANFREQLAWLAPHYLAFGALAGVFVLTEEHLGLAAFLVFGIPTAVLWIAEKQYLDRSRETVKQMRAANARLEETNHELQRLLDDNDRLLSRIHHSYLSTITSLARTIEAKDPYTGGHTERVAQVARRLATELSFTDEDLRAVEVGSVIHDIGKIGVPDAVLLKPGPLTPEERQEMERHVEMSSYIVAELELPAIVKQMVRGHHERYDGRGYPDGLAGEEIPLAARILSVADALDAMTSDRPYRSALPFSDAVRVIEENTMSQFCPHVVSALKRCLGRDPELSLADPAEPALTPTPTPTRMAL